MTIHNRLDIALKSLGHISPSCVSSIKTWIDDGGYVAPLQHGIACRVLWQELQITLITVTRLHNSDKNLTIGVPFRVLKSSKIPGDSLLKWRDDLAMLEDMRFDSKDNQGTMLVSRSTPAKHIITVFKTAREMLDRL